MNNSQKLAVDKFIYDPSTDEIQQAVKSAGESSLRTWHAMRFCRGFKDVPDDAFLNAVAAFHKNGHLMRIHEGYIYMVPDES